MLCSSFVCNTVASSTLSNSLSRTFNKLRGRIEKNIYINTNWWVVCVKVCSGRGFNKTTTVKWDHYIGRKSPTKRTLNNKYIMAVYSIILWYYYLLRNSSIHGWFAGHVLVYARYHIDDFSSRSALQFRNFFYAIRFQMRPGRIDNKRWTDEKTGKKMFEKKKNKKQNHNIPNTNNYDAVRLVMHILHWRAWRFN